MFFIRSNIGCRNGKIFHIASAGNSICADCVELAIQIKLFHDDREINQLNTHLHINS